MSIATRSDETTAAYFIMSGPFVEAYLPGLTEKGAVSVQYGAGEHEGLILIRRVDKGGISPAKINGGALRFMAGAPEDLDGTALPFASCTVATYNAKGLLLRLPDWPDP